MQAIYTDEEIKLLIEGDSKMITLAFSRSKELGKVAILSALRDFQGLLTSVKGKYVPSMDLDHRRYIVGLLKLTSTNIAEEHKEILLEQIVFPKGC